MELNRAHKLVHDDTAMEKLRTDHNIPNDIMIDKLRPREDANTTEGTEESHLNLVEDFGRGLICESRLLRWLTTSTGLGRLLALRIRELVAKCRTTSLEELIKELSKNARISRDLVLNEQKSSPNSCSTREVEEGEEVNQVEVAVPKVAPFAPVPATSPILVKSYGSKGVDDHDFPLEQPATRYLIEHSFTEADAAEMSLEEVQMALNPRALSHHAPKRCGGPRCRSLKRSMAKSVRMKKYSSNAKKILKKTNTLESNLKKALVVKEQFAKPVILLLPSPSLSLMLPKKNFTRLCKIYMSARRWLLARFMNKFLTVATAEVGTLMRDKWPNFALAFFKKAGSHV
ncbi:hypothetical protein Acr_00g0100550 [Actinidia rufa]|uniref:Uncharacterized protein n=1 Tax=Actinidia rufa TaxID=165716 RepID=A0A7J0E056_9ERIC|nr:hypothetical protein Acr_00g0100550 [Actinidia rufa]